MEINNYRNYTIEQALIQLDYRQAAKHVTKERGYAN